MKKKIFILLLLLATVPLLGGAKNYNYAFFGHALSSTPGMTFSTYFDSRTLGVDLGSPEDLVVYDDQIYLIDSAKNNLLVISKEYTVVHNLSEFRYTPEYIASLPEVPAETETTLSGPKGIAITVDGVYIADSKNGRIIHMNHNFEIINIFYEGEEEFIEGLVYEPKKITVDSTGRMYVVIDGAYEGILELNNKGEFNRFVGTNKITLSPIEALKRALMSEAQKEKLALELSTSYTNVNINQKGFIYATAKPTKNNHENMIQLINPKGVDVLKRNGYHVPMGDVSFIETSNPNTKVVGPSSLVDVAHTTDGIYTVLDEKRARMFTYDQEGNLLYINGESSEGASTQNDKIEKAIALDYLGDDLLVLDADQRSKKVIVFSLTEFGSKVNLAISNHNNGDFIAASKVWEEVLKLNTNYEIAYNGIGKNQLRQGFYKEAMKNFKLGHDQYYYSKAFKSYRDDILKKNFTWIVLGVTVLLLIPVGFKYKDKFIKKGGKKNESN